MEMDVARKLIADGVPRVAHQLWYDLGAGSGLFTHVLAEIMVIGKIVAIDKDEKVMASIPGKIGQVNITKRTADFSSEVLRDGIADGILMANALHFVKDKLAFLKDLKSGLAAHGILIVVEYGMTAPNPWVPYPVTFESLVKLAGEAGFADVRKLSTTASRYHKDGMYSAVVSQ